MKMKKLNYDEVMNINGGGCSIDSGTREHASGRRDKECRRDWGRVSRGIAEIGLGLSYKTNNEGNDNRALAGLIDRGIDNHIENGSRELKRGWYGGCSVTEYKRSRKFGRK